MKCSVIFFSFLVILVLLAPGVAASSISDSIMSPAIRSNAAHPYQVPGWSLTTDRGWYNIGDIVTFLVTKPQTHGGGASCITQVDYYITVRLPDGRQSSFDIGALPDPPGLYPETAGPAGPPAGSRSGELWGQGQACVSPQPGPSLFAATTYLVQETGSCQYGGVYPNYDSPPSCQYGGTYPNCNAAPSCQYGGSYPNCNAPPLCPNGGNYPNCNPSTTTVTQQQPPLVIQQPTQPDYGLPIVLLALLALIIALFKSRNKPSPTQPQSYMPGAPQRSACRLCGTPLRPGSWFCPRCGRPT